MSWYGNKWNVEFECKLNDKSTLIKLINYKFTTFANLQTSIAESFVSNDTNLFRIFLESRPKKSVSFQYTA